MNGILRKVAICFIAIVFPSMVHATDIDNVLRICNDALDAAAARLDAPAPTAVTDNPQAEYDATIDSIEVYSDRMWTIDAYVAARKAYAIAKEYGIKPTPKQNLTYLAALTNLKGHRHYLKNLEALVRKIDSTDVNLLYNGYMLLTRAYIKSNRPADASAAALKALDYASSDDEKIYAFTEANVAANDAADTYTFMMTTGGLDQTARPGSRQYVALLDQKAAYASRLGQSDEVCRLRVDCADEAYSVFGSDAILSAHYANKAFNSLVKANRRDEAEVWLERILDIIKANSGHSDFYDLIFNTAAYQFYKGASDAFEIMGKAYYLQKKTRGFVGEAAEMAASLAYCAYLINDFQKAAEYQKQSVALAYLTSGLFDLSTATKYANLATYHAANKDYREARKAINNMITAYRTCLPLLFSTMPSADRFDLFNSERISNPLGNLVPQLALVGIVAPEDAYAAALLYKGILLATENELRDKIALSGDSVLVADYDRYKVLLREIDERSMADGQRPEALIAQAKLLESSLMERSESFQAGVGPFRIYHDDIQYYLKGDEMAVEFIQAQFPDDVVYGAVCLRKNGPPQVRYLLTDSILRGISPDSYYSGPELYKAIWEPVLKDNPDVKKIYFAPSARMHDIAIEYVPDSTGTPINEQLAMHRVSSTRIIARQRGHEYSRDVSASGNAVIFGGINYYPDEYEMAENLMAVSAPDASATRSAFHKSRSGMRIAFLPGTLDEAKEIDAMASDCGLSTSLLADIDGSEGAFKKLSGSGVNLLHIATHGFYFPENKKSDESEILERAGLIMAGAGIDLTEVQSEYDAVLDDGFLTAREIAHVDLENLDLVVLSACETALGDSNGEGVFGLQRGFKKADANSIMMTLTKVDDRATQVFMNAFYRNFLGRKGKNASLAAAQRELRLFDGGVFDHPRYWAPFILLDALD